MHNLLSRVSLSSWDEAWYAVISKNIYNSGDFINLIFNNKPFYDHPPFVFWLQTIAYRIFGINEFAVRFPSFVLGLLTLVVVYLIGKELFSKSSGVFAALSLSIAPWFLTRSMSGNLDVPLTFLFALSFYFAIKSSITKKYLIPLSVSLSFLFLTKSLVPFTIIPALVYILWKKVNFKNLVVPFVIFLLITTPWFLINIINNPDFINRYLSIGYPGNKTDTNIWQNILLTKTYLHNGVGNIFIYGLVSLIAGLLFFRKKYLPIVIFISTFLLPFAFSNKGHIWHLIPLYPFWILSFYGFVGLITKKYRFVVILALFLVISSTQIKKDWYEIIQVTPYTSDIEILATRSQEYGEPLILDDDAVPEALFYSNKQLVKRTLGRGDLRNIFDTKESLLLITREWRLTEENILAKEYTLIAKDRDKVLILKK